MKERVAYWEQQGGELVAKADIDEIYESEMGGQPAEVRTPYAVRISQLLGEGRLEGAVDDSLISELGQLAAAAVDEARASDPSQ